MRFGVFADVHANWHALDAALSFLAGQHVDGFLCAGDLVGYGPLPNRTADRVLSLPGHVVAGNHELIVLGELGDGDCTDFARASLRWTRDVLDGDLRVRLAALPHHAQIQGVVALAHGSWDDPQRYVRTEGEAQVALSELQSWLPDAELLILGHTHEALAVGQRAGELLRGGVGEVALPRGDRVLLNPGSVGQARGGRARARVMILDLERHSASFHSLRYDTRSCRRALRELGLPPSSCHVRASGLERACHVLGRHQRALLPGRHSR
ncbi:MAG: metallophosphoesterase family protein [Solirubrobacteraceae bacterium]